MINLSFINTLFCSAREVMVMDSKTIHLKEFSYDGLGGDGVYFWVGHGPQPSSKGIKVPDELGYLEPLNAYGRQVIKLTSYTFQCSHKIQVSIKCFS